MSFSREKRESIKHYMLEKISEGATDFVHRTVVAFNITSSTVYRYLRELLQENVVEKRDGQFHLIRNTSAYHLYVPELTPEDDDVFFMERIYPKLSDLPNNILRIWSYCFTEMMNNVIDHSMAQDVTVVISRNAINTTIILSDNGIGIFQKIKNYYHFSSLDDAIIELFKGKLTTDSTNHSGEGIFFSSRIMDVFALFSDGKIFSHTEYDELITDLRDETLSFSIYDKGTSVLMKISNTSKKTTKEIMDEFSDEYGSFVRTRLPLKNIFPTFPVSRSQARRLTNRFDTFSEIELDFDGINEIGQAFTHELFVVYSKKHPNIKLIPFNTSIDIQRMINHVRNSVDKS